MTQTLETFDDASAAAPDFGGGDTVVCASMGFLPAAGGGVDTGRLAAVVSLDSRADIERLLVGLAAYPDVRHVVLCGSDSRAAGEALLAIWGEGVDDEGNVPGSRGHIAPELDRALVDELRGGVQIIDLRGEALDALVGAVKDLPELAVEREAQRVPESAVARRRRFLSRRTSFPIFSSDVSDSWLQLLNLALRIGADKRSEAGDVVAEALNAVVTIETPVFEDGEVEPPPEFEDCLDFTEDDFDRLYFPHFGRQFAHFGGGAQLDAACERLSADHDTLTATVVLDQTVGAQEGERPHGLISATFNIVDERLYASYVLRECDVYTEWPLRAAALVRMQEEVADRLGVERGSTTFVIHAAVLGEWDFTRSLAALERFFVRPLPLHVDPSGVFLFGSDADGARAMLLDHDASEIFWEDAFKDPEDLSWYIVDVMPWLLPQHIRYVGQECASLMRAISEGECYLQG